MKLEVQNLMGLDQFEADFIPGIPNYVFGGNSAGKTSLCTALAAVLSQTANPYHLRKGHTKLYITKGKADGVASLDGDRVLWTAEAISAPGDAPPDSIPHAVGMVDFVTDRRGEADRAALWETLFLPAEVRAIVEPALKGFNETEIAQIVKTIEDEGWVKAQSLYEGQRRHAKTTWSKITGERWGDKKVHTWRPNNWREELATMSEASLNTALADAQDARNKLLSHQSVSAAEIEKARRVRDEDVPAAQRVLDEKNKDFERIKASYEEAAGNKQNKQTKLDQLSARWREIKAILQAEPPHRCPSCDIGLYVSKDGVPTQWLPPEKEVLEEAQASVDDVRDQGKQAKQDLAAAIANFDSVFETYDKVSGEVTQAEVALSMLQKQTALAGQSSSDGPSQDEVDYAENMVREASDDMIAWKQYTEAKREGANVTHFDAICEVLGPTGARASIMNRAMGAIRKAVKTLCGTAEWLPVEILRDYTVVSDGIVMKMAADNERLKTQWLCQMATAIVKKNKWLVLDKADTLQFEDWEGLQNVLDMLSEKIPDLHIIVCATDDGSMCPENWNPIDLQAGE